MKQWLSRIAARVVDKIAERTAQQVSNRVLDRIAYEIKLGRILDTAATGKKPLSDLFRGIDENFWYWLNTEGQKSNPELRAILPGWPSEDVYLTATGYTGERAQRHAFSLYRLFRGLVENHQGRLDEGAAILDFGCGWGRILRFFLRDVDPSELWGIDIRHKSIEVACQLFQGKGHFEAINAHPPTAFPEGMFGLIYSYSVFSHLAEDVHNEWLAEFRRILKPDGILIATTLPRSFMEMVDRFRKKGLPQHDARLGDYMKELAATFPDMEKHLADYDNGKYCFAHRVTKRGQAYGETCIPKQYVLDRWTGYFTFVDYIDDPEVCDQNVIVVSKAGREEPRLDSIEKAAPPNTTALGL